MVAGEASCACPQCGTVCTGRFAGCAQVWRTGPTNGRGLGEPTGAGPAELILPARVVANGALPGSARLELGPAGGVKRPDQPLERRPRSRERVANLAADQMDLVGEIVEEVSVSVSEMVRQAMSQVIDSQRLVLASLARVEANQRSIREDLDSLANATADDLTDIAAFLEWNYDQDEERLFDLAKRVAYLTEQMTPRLEPDRLAAENGKTYAPSQSSSAKRAPGATSPGRPASAKAEVPRATLPRATVPRATVTKNKVPGKGGTRPVR